MGRSREAGKPIPLKIIPVFDRSDEASEEKVIMTVETTREATVRESFALYWGIECI